MPTVLRNPEQLRTVPAQRGQQWLRSLKQSGGLLGLAELVAVLFIAVREHAFWGGHFYFDDAYMYARYAYNVRHGWGIAWNPAGPHTFGLTSLPWFFVILAGGFFTQDLPKLLTWSSCLTGLVAMGALCSLIGSIARSGWMKRPLLLLPWIALPLLLQQRFAATWSNGMETMLGMLALTLFLMSHKRFEEHAGWCQTATLALCALFSALSRPELLLVVILLPLLAWALRQPRKRFRPVLVYLALVAALVLAVLTASYRYFQTAVPLAFYLKAQRGYSGYSLLINPWTYATIFLSIGMPALLLLAGLARPRHARLLAVFLVPLLAEMMYLATVTQIMGEQARYYIPLLPLLIVPAGLLVDDAIGNGTPYITPARALAVGTVLLLGRDFTRPITLWMGERMAAHTTFYERPVFSPKPPRDLPMVAAWAESAKFAAALPAGSVMASTEVGMLGAYAPQISVIDLAGLNDVHLARHSSDLEYILSKKPDVIWLPNTDYTHLYGSLVSSPAFLRDYDLYQQYLQSGLAVRKASRSDPALEGAVQQGWQAIYPGFPMENYRVTQVQWDANRTMQGSPVNVLERYQSN